MGCSGSKKAPQAQAASKVAQETPEGDFKITVQNTQGEAGLGLVAKFPEKAYILVESLKDEGLIPSWNKANVNTPDVLIKPGDMFVAINGKFGNSDEMLVECKAESITFVVKRAPSPAAATEPPAAEAASAEAPATELPAAGGPAAEDPAAESPAAATEAAAAEAPAAEVPPAADAPPAENLAVEWAATPLAAEAPAGAPAAEAPATEQAAVEPAAEPAPTDADLGLADTSIGVEPESTEMEPAATGAKTCVFC